MTTKTATPDGFAQLRRPFPPGQIGKLPRKNRDDGSVIYLDYVGHGRITDRLLEVDPAWTWRPYAHDERGLPLIVEDARGQLALWIVLSVCGQERIGVGTCGKNAYDPLKELIGDALRNAAMRFGVALDLWIRDEEHLPPGSSARSSLRRRGISSSRRSRFACCSASRSMSVECRGHYLNLAFEVRRPSPP